MKKRFRGTDASDPDLYRTAIHEAGHFVAALVAGGNIQVISIEGDETRCGFIRRVQLEPADWAQRLEAAPDHRRHVTVGIESEIRFCLAGYAAESILVGRLARSPWRLDDGPDGDATHARALADVIWGTRTCAFLQAHLVDREYRRVRRFLTREWSRVTLVARALRRHQTIEGEKLVLLRRRVGWITHPRYQMVRSPGSPVEGRPPRTS